MFSELEKTVEEKLSQWLGPEFSDRVYLIALSGGPDSTALLHTMARTLGQEQCRAAHFNHRLRDEDSDLDEAFAERESKRLGIEFVSARGPRVRQRAPGEEELRRERHQFLRRTADELGCDYILTAHHAQDQLETFLMRMLRGAGVDGLSAIHPRRGRYLRPFLTLSRETIFQTLLDEEIDFRTDASNHSPRYFRNRVREQLIPPLFDMADEFGGTEAFLSRFSGLTAELEETVRWLTKRTQRHFSKSVHATPYWIRFEKSNFFARSIFWQLRLLREILLQLGAPIPDREALEAARLSLWEGKPSLSLPGAVTAEQSCGFLFFHSPSQRWELNHSVHWDYRGGRARCEALGITLRVPNGMECRFFQAGDRFEGKKLKEILLELKIPRLERRLLPILALPGSSEVLWFFPQQDPNVVSAGPTFPFSFYAP